MIITPKDLKARFAYQFSGKHLGRTHFRGWFPVFAKLCEDVDELLGEDKRGFNWLQIKEKWGTGHFYWEMQGISTLRLDLRSPGQLTSIRIREQAAGSAQPSLAERITDLVRRAERETVTQCIVCGQPATISDEEAWVLALCDKHAQVRRTADNWSAWMKEHALFPPEEQ
jgi:hypothetical protein